MQGVDLGIGQFDIHAAEIINDIGDLFEREKDIFLNPDADMLTDDLTEFFRPVIIVDVIDPAELLFGVGGCRFLDDGVADKGRQHDPVSPGIERNQNNAIGIAVHITPAAAVTGGRLGPGRTGIPAPLVNAKEQIVMLAFHDGGKLIIGDNLNRLRKPLVRHLRISPFLRREGHLRIRFSVRISGRIRTGNDIRFDGLISPGKGKWQENQHKKKTEEFPHDANTPLTVLGINVDYTIEIKKIKEEIRSFDHKMKQFRKTFSFLCFNVIIIGA